jgi:GT2 family glycosyltransferase
VALLLPRELFLELGGFDERFFMYYEDVDLCERLVQHGGEVVLDERWQVRHIGGHSSAQSETAVLIRTYDSGRYFFQKHYGTTRYYDLVWRTDTALRLAWALLRGDRKAAAKFRAVGKHVTYSK